MFKQSPKQVAQIKLALRQRARYMPELSIARERARDWTKHGVRGGAMYKCNHCKESFLAKDIQVDHIEPVVPVGRELDNWDEYINRLYCSVDNLQVLCKPCHLVKSNGENEKRTNSY